MKMDSIQELKSKLPEYLRQIGIDNIDKFPCLHPAHDDKHPSMSYDRKTNRVHCFSCKESGDVFDVIGWREGITNAGEQFKRVMEIFGMNAPTKPAEIVTPKKTKYVYCDANGQTAFKVERIDEYDAAGKRTKKRFLQYHRDGDGWKPGLNGLHNIPFPYRLRDIRSANVRAAIIVEGEKCVNALRDVLHTARVTDYAVTTISGGANNWRNLGAFVPYLQGLAVIIIPDNDKAGRTAFIDGVNALVEAEGIEELDVVNIDIDANGNPAEKKYDVADLVADWRRQGMADAEIGRTAAEYIGKRRKRVTAEMIAEMADKAKETTTSANEKRNIMTQRVKVTPLSQIEEKDIEWLWKDKFQAGAIGLILGKQGSGKTFITCMMAAHITNGLAWPDGQHCEKGAVIFFPGEDNIGSVLRKRLKNNGADENLVFIFEGVENEDEHGADVEEITIERGNMDFIRRGIAEVTERSGVPVKAVFIDPVSNFWGVTRENSNDEVRKALRGLQLIAEETGAAFILIHHVGKADRTDARDTGLGSTAIQAVPRSVWTVSRIPNDPNVYFTFTKGNNIINKKGFTFQIGNDGGVKVGDQTDLTTNDIMDIIREARIESNTARRGRPNGRPTVERAVGFLQDYLADGPKLIADVMKAGQETGLSKDALKTAKREAGVKSSRSGPNGPYLWSQSEP